MLSISWKENNNRAPFVSEKRNGDVIDMTKKEFKKYRKDTLPEIHYQNVFEDGVIEVQQGFFTKTYFCAADILSLFDFIYDLHTKKLANVNKPITTELTCFNKVYYITVGVYANSYEESLEVFVAMDYMHEVRAMVFIDRMKLLHAMYQNDDRVQDRYMEFAKPKKGTEVPNEFAARMKNFKRNGKISKDLILPKEMKAFPGEIEFEGNYVKFFYLKNMPRYVTKEFMDDLFKIDNVFFSIHLKPLDQLAIAEYATVKFEETKDLKDNELIQRRFFEQAIPELRKSAKKEEEMFLATFVFGLPNDSLDELDAIFGRLVRELEDVYAVKELTFQQKNAFNTLLPFCSDKLDIQTTVYKYRELGGVF